MGSIFNPHYICQKLVSLIHAVSIYLIPLFTFLSTHFLRLQRNGSSLIKKNEKEIEFLETEHGLSPENRVADEFSVATEEEDEPELHLKFKFPTFEEFSRIQKGTGNIINSEVVPSSFTSEKSLVSAFIHEQGTFPVSEINESRITDFSVKKEDNFFSNEKSGQFHIEKASVRDKGKQVLVCDDGDEKTEPVQEFLDESQFSSEKSSVVDDSESGSTSNSQVMNSGTVLESYSDGFLSDGDFGGGFESESEISVFEENQNDSADDEESESVIEELEKLEEEVSINAENPEGVSSDFLSEKDFNEDKNQTMNGGDDEKQKSTKNSSMADSGKLESLWEHQELIEQLKMELRKVRATGLPTILEESESPKIMDDLKPWKIDEKFHREDCIGELQKFYKSYREKMRKFDILNYQKMYAMGFLQLKDPLQSISEQKPSPPTLKSLVSQKMWLFKHKVHGSDPMKKFIEELQGDLEVVYVGHVCLSWEFLHWQYEKALELWESDPRGIHRYNEVAGEFQQFQVLVQRFIEDEPFQGPRVQNYVKSRCVLRNLLQVPVIREDNMRDKRKAKNKDTDEYVITSDTLVEIMEESIRIFWRFIRADKDSNSSAINVQKKMLPELQNPEDLKLLAETRKLLQKKEKKVKDLLRSENCILRKFRQCREDDDSDQVLYFFSQVDMRLVSRVLNMSKITRDQLTWCHNKLSRISFVNRKIYVEPAFLLFPC